MTQSIRALVAALTLTVALSALAAAETWVIDPPHTVSGFTVRHMMITNVNGAFEMTTDLPAAERPRGDDNGRVVARTERSRSTSSVMTVLICPKMSRLRHVSQPVQTRLSTR